MAGSLAVLAAVVAACGGAWTYVWQKSVDRREALIAAKKSAYQAYLGALTDFTVAISDASIDQSDIPRARERSMTYTHALNHLELYASTEVSLAALELQQAFLKWRRSPKELELYRDVAEKRGLLLREMRKELFGDDDVRIEALVDVQGVVSDAVKKAASLRGRSTSE